IVWRDLRPVLDEELGRLPERYRAPLVLCYLEGKSHAEAAGQLGWPEGSVCGRLARGRELLRRRLMRRGLTLSVAVLAGALSEGAASSSVPAVLAGSTLSAALAFAAGNKGMVSGTVLALTEGVLRAMSLNRLKIVAAVILLLGGLTVGTMAVAN